MNNRIRTQKKVYTPTTSVPESEHYWCQVIETGERIIVHRSSMKRVCNNKVDIMVCGRRMEAKIEFEEPSFRVRLGSFNDRLEAERKFLIVRKKFPNAMILNPKN